MNISNIFKKSRVVYRYVDKQSFDSCQILWEEYRLFGVLILKKELDREIIPNWASMQVTFLGSTEWRSRLLRDLYEI
jgi:hypothetical protein